MDMEAGSSSQPKTYPKFNHIILPHNLEDGTLEIPQKFVKEHGSYLPMYACLEVPTGKLWKVELKRCDGHVWLHRGWKDFVQKCSIACGYSLMFIYEGGSFFHVFIFNASGLEIEYPVGSASTNQMVNLDQSKSVKNEEDTDEDSSIEILDDWPHKSREEPVVDIQSTNIEGDNEVLGGEGTPPSNGRNGVVERARTFQSQNPHFTVLMPPTCLSHLDIPESSARGYFYERGDEGIYLNGPDRRAWFMKYCIEGPPPCQVRISSGWSEFAQEYRLRDGDACIFELINSKFMVFNVTLFQITDEEGENENEEVDRSVLVETRDTPDPTTQAQQRLGRAESSQCSKPSFSVVHKVNAHSLYTLCVPFAAHASRYLSGQHDKEVFLHGVAERTWSVKCYAVGKNIRLSKGWKDFVVDNYLKGGDTCVFELFSQAPNHYKVTILRAAQSENPI